MNISKVHYNINKQKQAEKLARELMNTKEYREAHSADRKQDVLKAYRNIAFFGCEFLEMRHYKTEGLKKFLKFLQARMNEIGSDPTYFADAQKYYKEKYDLDVFTELGIEIDKD